MKRNYMRKEIKYVATETKKWFFVRPASLVKNRPALSNEYKGHTLQCLRRLFSKHTNILDQLPMNTQMMFK